MASGLYPRKSPRPTSSRAEQALHRALTTGLPAGWTAWHSLRVRTAKGYLGEGDFVIAVPGRGVLVVEVKGGAIEQRDGHWFQNGRRLARMPLDQAHDYRTTLLNALRDRGVRDLPFFAVAVAFVDTPFSAGPTQSDLRGAVLGQQDLTYIREALSEMAERLLSDKRVPGDSRWLDVLHELWGETWTPHLALGDRIRLREEELVPLDADQLAVLDAVEDNDRMLVRGGPGTGKTLLARDACRRFAARGHRPALLCSTSALATALRAGGLDSAFTVRALAADLLELAGVTLADGAPRSAWSADTWEQAPAIAADTLAALGPARERVDAVVVDEGQDLSDSDWLFVRALAHERPLWAFVDEAQGFWADRQCPSELFSATWKLVARYRCPEALARFADQYREERERTKRRPWGTSSASWRWQTKTASKPRWLRRSRGLAAKGLRPSTSRCCRSAGRRGPPCARASASATCRCCARTLREQRMR